MTRFPSYKSYIKGEEETTKLTFEKFKEEFRQYELFFDLFMETIDCLARSTKSKVPDTEGKGATIAILPRVAQSMESIRLLTAKGHYYDAAIIERSLLESIGLCAHLSSNEEEASRWIRGEPIKLASIDLVDLGRWLHLGKHDTKMKKVWNAVYGQLCNYVHTNVRGAVSMMGRFEKKEKRIGGVMSGTIYFQYAPRFDESRAKGIAAFPVLVTLIVEDIFKAELKPYKKRQKKSDGLHRQYLTLLKSHPN